MSKENSKRFLFVITNYFRVTKWLFLWILKLSLLFQYFKKKLVGSLSLKKKVGLCLVRNACVGKEGEKTNLGITAFFGYKLLKGDGFT